MQDSFIFDVRIAQSFWLVALAGLRHPFPSRTRPLRAPAAMILRPGARESSAPPTSISNPCTASRGAGIFFARPLAARQDAMSSICPLLCNVTAVWRFSVLMRGQWPRVKTRCFHAPLAVRGAPRGHWPRVRTRCFHAAVAMQGSLRLRASALKTPRLEFRVRVRFRKVPVVYFSSGNPGACGWCASCPQSHIPPCISPS